MSLAALCSRDTITIARLSTTQGDAGGQVRSYTAAARGSLDTSSTGRIQPLTADERIAYGLRGERLSWKFFTTSNPSLTVRDQVTFTDADGTSRTCDVIEPSRNLDGQGRLWMVILEEISNET